MIATPATFNKMSKKNKKIKTNKKQYIEKEIEND